MRGRVTNGCPLINIEVTTPTGRVYPIEVEGALCKKLIFVFDEVEDMPCKSWIYEKLNDKITQSTPYFNGTYLGYYWRKKLI